MGELLTPAAVDDMFGYPSGRALRLARKGLLPYMRLPDGSIRFDAAEIARVVASARVGSAAGRKGGGGRRGERAGGRQAARKTPRPRRGAGHE